MNNKNYLSIYAKSFNWAGFFLPKETYKKCSALYNFCRVVDNIADEKNQLEIKKKKIKDFEDNFKNKNFDNSVIENMWTLINEFNISLDVIYDLFDGIKSDIKNEVKFTTKKDLIIYSYRVAGTVGIMMAKILKVNEREHLKSAIDLGIAMQLTNISRDVIEDSENNRFYINKNFEDIKSTLKLAEHFYNNSFYSIKEIPLIFRFSILVARRVYRRIGYKILSKKNFENYQNSGKIYVTIFEKSLETLFSIFDLIKLSFSNQKKIEFFHESFFEGTDINIDKRF